MTVSLGRQIFCNYFDGMFANEPMNWGPGDIRAHMVQQERRRFTSRTCLSCNTRFGLGCLKISLFVMTKMEGEERRAITESPLSKQSDCRQIHTRNINRGKFCSCVLAGGIASAAGPAAERKYYLQRNVPIRTLGATEGDHEKISKTAKGLELAGRNRYAYQRLVWRQAQVELEHEKIWLAAQ